MSAADDIINGVMGAFSHPKRREILRLINAGESTTYMARKLSITRAGLHKHLVILRKAGIIEPRIGLRGGYMLTEIGKFMQNEINRLLERTLSEYRFKPSPYPGYAAPSFREVRENKWT
jgi:DNA-binding transcriptional ArsR family regulator